MTMLVDKTRLWEGGGGGEGEGKLRGDLSKVEGSGGNGVAGVRHCPFCALVDKTSGEFGDARVHLQVTRQDDEPQGEGCSTVVLRLFL